jgi:hypothetical protein
MRLGTLIRALLLGALVLSLAPAVAAATAPAPAGADAVAAADVSATEAVARIQGAEQANAAAAQAKAAAAQAKAAAAQTPAPAPAPASATPAPTAAPPTTKTPDHTPAVAAPGSSDPGQTASPVPVPPAPPAPDQAQAQLAQQAAVTSQVIRQVQIGCLRHCFDTTQEQAATQSASTRQLGHQTQAADGATRQTQTASQGSITAQSIDQLKIGCSGTCAADPAAASLADWATVVRDVLAAQGVPDALQASVQSATGAQTSDQRQQGGGTQGQSALQVDVTSQILGQLQWGCLFVCQGTVLVQTAVQSSTTSQAIGQDQVGTPPGGGTQTQEAVQGAVTTQVIWQIQIGCLMYCYGTIQVQSATQQSTVEQVIDQRQSVAVPTGRERWRHRPPWKRRWHRRPWPGVLA